MTEPLWQQNPSWIGAELDETLVMFDVESGRYYGLNETATLIWRELSQPSSATAMIARLQAHFDVSAELSTAAVTRTLARLAEIGAVKPA